MCFVYCIDGYVLDPGEFQSIAAKCFDCLVKGNPLNKLTEYKFCRFGGHRPKILDHVIMDIDRHNYIFRMVMDSFPPTQLDVLIKNNVHKVLDCITELNFDFLKKYSKGHHHADESRFRCFSRRLLCDNPMMEEKDYFKGNVSLFADTIDTVIKKYIRKSLKFIKKNANFSEKQKEFINESCVTEISKYLLCDTPNNIYDYIDDYDIDENYIEKNIDSFSETIDIVIKNNVKKSLKSLKFLRNHVKFSEKQEKIITESRIKGISDMLIHNNPPMHESGFFRKHKYNFDESTIDFVLRLGHKRSLKFLEMYDHNFSQNQLDLIHKSRVKVICGYLSDNLAYVNRVNYIDWGYLKKNLDSFSHIADELIKKNMSRSLNRMKTYGFSFLWQRRKHFLMFCVNNGQYHDRYHTIFNVNYGLGREICRFL